MIAIEQLRSAGDQVGAALDNYFHVYSTIQEYCEATKDPHILEFLPGLTTQLDTELGFISLYEQKIKRIKSAISSARNYSLGPASINTLPPEILTRIFHLVVPPPCGLLQLSPAWNNRFPAYPECPAQVCALWRGIALSSPPLWCRIDLLPYEPGHGGAITQAEMRLERAGDLPIELHIVENQCRRFSGTSDDYIDLYNFVSCISNRVETLRFVVAEYFRIPHCPFFSRLLLGSNPQTLTKLVVGSASNYANAAFIYVDSDPEHANFGLNLTIDQLESAFAPLKVIHMRGIFPY